MSIQFLRPTTAIFLLFLIIQILEWDQSLVQAQYFDSLTSGTILNNLWRKRRDLSTAENNHKINNNEDNVAPKTTNKRWADYYTSGTILNNLWRKKRQAAIIEQQHPTHPEFFSDINSEINSDIIPRFKRQYYADGLTSGTILNNLCGRKKRWADRFTSGTILRNLWGR